MPAPAWGHAWTLTTPETAMTDTPQIYVGTYAKYNAGSIKGAWLDLELLDSPEAFFDACRELHADEHDPELMFQDWQCVPTGMVSESHISNELWTWLQLDDDERELIAVYQEHIDQSGTIDQAREAFAGRYTSAEDYAQELFEECHDIPDYLANYIDWQSVARDMGYDGTSFIDHEGETWVFRPI
jgi:antirestriction protein